MDNETKDKTSSLAISHWTNLFHLLNVNSPCYQWMHSRFFLLIVSFPKQPN